MSLILSYDQLKTRQREIREQFPQGLALRTHRALSWLQRAEQEAEDDDARFIFLWVAFNAAYAHEIPDRWQFGERRLQVQFLNRLITSDQDNLLYKIVWDEFPKSVRMLIDNRYVYQPFWDHYSGKVHNSEWEVDFKRSQAAALRALGRMDTKRALTVVFDRLYVLRNQLVHGGATWNSHVNRNQVRDGAAIMGELVPVVIHIMMEDLNRIWGDPCYPVIDD